LNVFFVVALLLSFEVGYEYEKQNTTK